MALVERLQLIIEAVGTGTVAREVGRAGDAVKTLGAQAKTGKLSLTGLAESAGISATALKAGVATAAVAAAGAVVKFGANSVAAFSEVALEVRNVQRAMGGTAEEASRLVAAGDDMNVSAETIGRSMFMLGKRIDADDEKLSAFGVTVARNAAGNVDMARTVQSIAEAYRRTADPAQRAALLAAAFGRAGREMIPILEQGAAGLDRMFAKAETTGQIFSQEDLDRAEQLRLAQDDLADAIGELQLKIGQGLTPAMTDLALAVARVIDGFNDIGSIGADAWDGVAAALGPIGDFLGDINAFNSDWFLNTGRDAGSAADGVDEFNTEIADTPDKLEDLISVSLGVTNAGRSLAQAQRSLNKLMREGAVDEEKVADARRSLAEATRSAASADRALARAQREYDEALAAANLLGGDTQLEVLTDASDRLADAKDNSASAHERENEAAQDLREAIAGDPEFNQKLADAKYEVATATYQAAQARKAEQEALSGAADEASRLKGELQQMIALNPALQELFGPLLTALGTPIAATTAPPPLAANLSPLASTLPFGAPSIPSATMSGGGLLSGATVTNNNITVNAPQQADPIQLAHEMVWALN